MAVATGEERPWYNDREECPAAGGKMADVNIACIFARRNSVKSSSLTRPYPHHTTEWLVGNMNIRPEFTGSLPQLVVMQVRLREVLGQQSETRYDRVPAPPLMLDTDDIDLKRIAWFRALHIYRAGERVNEIEIQGPDRLRGRIGTNLPRRGFEGLEYNGIAGLDAQARWKSIVPESMGLGVVEMMCRHGALLSKVHFSPDQRSTAYNADFPYSSR